MENFFNTVNEEVKTIFVCQCNFGFNCLNILSINYLLSGAKVGSFFIKKIYMNTVLHRKVLRLKCKKE